MKRPSNKKKSIAIVGGGPAGMILAAHLDSQIFDVTIYERNGTLGRKFLVAGKGGFNLTHGENMSAMKKRYTPIGVLDLALDAFDNMALRKWFEAIGIETFVGTSHRVFPTKGIKPVEVLKAVLGLLEEKNVTLKTDHTWCGFDAKNDLIFKQKDDEEIKIKADKVVFALGGKSWQKTGSQGEWTAWLKEKGVKIMPFEAANCSFEVNWSLDFIHFHEGKPLKNIAILNGDKIYKGELVVTAFGLEGGPIYAASGDLKASLKKGGTSVFIDLKPTLTLEKVTLKLKANHKKGSWTQHIKSSLKLSSTHTHLLKNYTDKETYQSPQLLAAAIKKLRIGVYNTAPIDEAISTTGGVSLEAVDEHFQLKDLLDHYVIGEMLDWDAPTGGYLLQGCMSMGVYLARALNR